MQRDNLYIYIICEDLVLTGLLEIIFNKFLTKPGIEKIISFKELKEKQPWHPPDIIILDDFITGASSLEVITFLRFNRRLDCPIFFFCESVPEIANAALQRGANYYYTKPFKPLLVVEEIISYLK